MTGPWGGEPGTPPGLQPPAPGSEPGDRLPGQYGGPPRDGGLPDGEPGSPDALPEGEPGVPARREPPREQHDRSGGPGPGGGRRPGPWRAPERRGDDGGPGPERPGAEPPEDVRTAWVLWLAATGFAAAGALLNALTSRLADLPSATRDAVADAASRAGDAASTEAVFRVAMTFGAVLALLAAVVTVWLAFRMRSGRGWARTLLDIVGAFLVVDAVAVLVGVFSGTLESGSRGQVTTFVVLSLQILAGLCAATAVWRQHTAEAGAYLIGGGRGRT